MSGSPPSRAKVWAGLVTVYLVWGSTYLAICVGLETIPPFFMSAMRYLSAGVILYAWARFKGAPREGTLGTRLEFDWLGGSRFSPPRVLFVALRF